MQNRRGMSDLVSNVLIILLVFVSIAIMGVIILNLVNLSGKGLEDLAACRQINVRPVQCIHNITDANLLFATEYQPGIKIKTITAYSELSDGQTVNQTILGSILGNFETQSVRESGGEDNYNKFYTVTTFTDKDGIDRTCTSSKIDCEKLNPNVDIVDPVVNPEVCGDAADDYPSTASSWVAGSIFCNDGTNPNPIFPQSAGSSVSWNCEGQTCTARRLSANQVSSGGGGGGGGGGSNNLDSVTIGNGACGATENICAPGTLNNIGDSATHYLWECVGTNGGTTASCSLAKPVSTGCIKPTLYVGNNHDPNADRQPYIHKLTWMSQIGCYYRVISDYDDQFVDAYTYNLVLYSGNGTNYTININSNELPLNYGYFDLIVFNKSRPNDKTEDYIPLTECNNSLNQAYKTYKLMNDIPDATGNCFFIAAPGVVLDGDNHYISGSGTGNGIEVGTNNFNNVVIKNFKDISRFQNGITLIASYGTTLDNVKANNSTLTKGLIQPAGQIDGLNIINSNIGRYAFQGSSVNTYIENTSYGKVRIDKGIKGDDYGYTLSSRVVFGDNNIYIASGVPNLNDTLQISLYGMQGRFNNNPNILKNGQVCSDCINITPLNASTVIFNVVKGGGTYSIANSVPYVDITVPANGYTLPLSHLNAIQISYTSNIPSSACTLRVHYRTSSQILGVVGNYQNTNFCTNSGIYDLSSAITSPGNYALRISETNTGSPSDYIFITVV